MKSVLTLILMSSLASVAQAKTTAPVAAKKNVGTRVVASEPEEKGPDRAPFNSEEDMEYVAVSPENMLGFMRSDAFLGVIIRPYAQNPALHQAELYSYPRFTSPVVDRKDCEKIVSQLTGPFNKISLKHVYTQAFKAATGTACEVALMDPDANAVMPDRRIFVVNLRKVNYVIQFKFPAKALATKTEVEDMRGFIKGLK